MATQFDRAGQRPFGRGPRPFAAWLLLTLLVCLPGCRGCNRTPEQIEKDKQLLAEEEEKKKKQEEIKPFEAGEPESLPTRSLAAHGMCKPGHWIGQTWYDLKSNLRDFQGEIQTEAVDNKNARLQLPEVPYRLADERPASLAKEQAKTLESLNYVPPTAVSVNFKLATAGGATVIDRSLILKAMPSFRYFFIVLSKGSRFAYLNDRLDSIRLHEPATSDPGPEYYQVVTMQPNRRPGLPAGALCWTSIAYLLWDDSDPAKWDLDQQQALVDWLHWGGQIIVSGPDALEQLQTSFLRAYLPATVGKARTFEAKDLKELGRWADNGAPPKPTQAWPGAILHKNPRAAGLPQDDDQLVIERRVGRGRIVVTAFRITGPEFTGWPGCDCFFNACLLRRGPRIPSRSPTGVKSFRWAEAPQDVGPRQFEPAAATQPAPNASTPIATTTAPGMPVPASAAGANVNYPVPRKGPFGPIPSPSTGTLMDAATNTNVRYFSRDAGVPFQSYASDISSPQAAIGIDDSGNPVDANGNIVSGNNAFDVESDDPASNPYERKVAPGLGAWNDYSPVAAAAQKALHVASGITVPVRGFIFWVVVGYLCVLVPANWLVFRLIGRVEWAWIAAPLIAIGCTVVVVHQAQLNIGFVRSRNEIAVIEMQPGYSRAHVTRYMDLYTSLATSYEFQVAEPSGQILPFPRRQPGEKTSRFLESVGEVVCRRGEDTRLSGFHVNSNSHDFVHSEEMTDFGGTIALRHEGDRWRATNGTKHSLENCQVVRGESPRAAAIASIDRLEPGETASLKFAKFNRSEAPADGPGTATAATGVLSADGVRQVALNAQQLHPDEVCFVARVADEVPGLTVSPAAQQFRQAALLVAHLDPGKLDAPAPDVKSGSTVAPAAPKWPGNSEDDSN